MQNLSKVQPKANVYKIKLDAQFVKSATISNMLEENCKMKDIIFFNFSF